MNTVSNSITIGNRRVGTGERCYIIAEVGINHNGRLDLAKQLVDAACEAGADAVKFQKRNLREVYCHDVLSKPENAEQGLQYLLPILHEFELEDDAFVELRDYCTRRGIQFLCTAFDVRSVDFLETLGVPAHKIGSPDMTNFPLLEYVAQLGKPILLSTGMSTEEEIRETVHFLDSKKAQYALFHCVSSYPAPPDEINLRFMDKLKGWSGRPVGYSGHEVGISVSVAAVAMGASLLERHLTLDHGMRGPDHGASLEPDEFRDLVRAVREVELALGSEHRWLTRGEVLNRRNLAKSLVASRDLPCGTVITRDMVASKSPGLGLSPQKMEQLIGRKLQRSMRKDEPFREEDIEPNADWKPLAQRLDIGLPWGVIARFADMDKLINKFAVAGMSTLEFHLSDRDLDAGMKEFFQSVYPFDLCIHAPEYSYDYLIDLCASDETQYQLSIRRIQQTVNLTRTLSRYFTKIGPRGPKIIFHVGGMSQRSGPYDLDRAIGRLLEGLKKIDHSDVDLLLENLPPFPWYFGGRWYGHVLTDAQTTEDICKASRLGLCFDTSHALLQCNYDGYSLVDFARRVRPYVRHIHISDGAGISGEGLQIGEGQINFVELMPILLECEADAVPEIWMGHHGHGQGFCVALERLQEIVWAVRALDKVVQPVRKAHLRDMIVLPEASIADALRAIDRNQMGVIFVVSAEGVLVGLATDGDIRRGLLKGASLRAPIRDIMNTDYVYVYDTTPPEHVRHQLLPQFRVVPIIDAAHKLLDFVAMRDHVGGA